MTLKHKYLVCALCGVFLSGGFFLTVMTPKMYGASTVIKIAAHLIKRRNLPGFKIDPNFYNTQYELIKSRKLADRVATELNLAQTEFVGKPSVPLLDRLLGRQTTRTNARDASALKHRHDQAVDQIMEGLSVEPVPKSSIVQIRFESSSPEWAQRISVGVAEQFGKMTLEMRSSESSYARRFLEERLQELNITLLTSEKQLVAYAQKEGIVDVDSKQPQVMTELQGVENAYSQAVTSRLLLVEAWNQAQADGGTSLPQVMGDGLIQAVRGKLSQLRATYQDRLTVVKPDFPEMIALRTQIREAENDIESQINLIKNSIKLRYDAALVNEKSLGDKLEELKAKALDLRGRSVDYRIFLRELDANRSVYDGLLEQFRRLSVKSDADSNNVSILDRAQLPLDPDSPSLNKNLLIAFILGLVTAAGAIWVIEILDDTFKTPEDLEENLGLSVLGITPLFRDCTGKKTALEEVVGDPTSPLAEAYRSLRTALQFSTSEGAPRSLLITSSRPNEGKSTTTVCTALNFGLLGLRVLMIDGDLRNPSLHRILSLDNSEGLSNYLSEATRSGISRLVDGHTGLGMIKQTNLAGVSVMTSGPLPPNPADLLAGPRFIALLKTAAESFDMVIIDGPPIMGLADAPILSSLTDGAMLVVEGAKTRRAVVRDALKRLYFARARVVGGVLNKFHPKHGAAGYGYGYEYGYGYGKGYGATALTSSSTARSPKAALNTPQDAA